MRKTLFEGGGGDTCPLGGEILSDSFTTVASVNY